MSVSIEGFSVERAMKCKSPFIGIPRIGMRPLIVPRVKFQFLMKGLTIKSMGWIGEGIEIKGKRDDGTVSRVVFIGAGVGVTILDILMEHSDWARAERERRAAKIAIAPVDGLSKRETARVKKVDAAIVKLRKRLGSYELAHPEADFLAAIRRMNEPDRFYGNAGQITAWRNERELRRKLYQGFTRGSYAGADEVLGRKLKRASQMSSGLQVRVNNRGYAKSLWIIAGLTGKPHCYGDCRPPNYYVESDKDRRESYLGKMKERAELVSQIEALEALK